MGWVVNATPRLLYRQKSAPVTTVQESGWVSGSVWTDVEEISCPLRSTRPEPSKPTARFPTLHGSLLTALFWRVWDRILSLDHDLVVTNVPLLTVFTVKSEVPNTCTQRLATT
jgi:hypothetical protein